MTQTMALELMREAFWHAVLLGAPMLTVAVLVGVIVSVIQAVTQVQEQTLSFVPKLAAMGGAFFVASAWMLQTLVEYTGRLLRMLPGLAP